MRPSHRIAYNSMFYSIVLNSFFCLFHFSCGHCTVLVAKQKYANALRFTAMVVSGMLSVIGSKAIGFPSAGALGCATMACVCARTWRKPQNAKNVRQFLYLYTFGLLFALNSHNNRHPYASDGK